MTRKHGLAKDEKCAAGAFPKARRQARRTAALTLLAAAAASAQAGDPLRGADLYRRHCSACHGADGKPVLPIAPDFTRHGALLKPDLVLAASVRRGRGTMPAYDGLLHERDLLDIVSHLRTLQ